MGWWSTDDKGKGAHDHEAGSSSDRRRAAREPRRSSPPRRPAPAAFSIAPPGAPTRSRQYVNADVCSRYWETRTPLPWSDIHLLNNWHLSVDRVTIPSVPMSGHARRDEIQRRLPDDLYYDPRYAVDSPLWDTWFATSTMCGARPALPVNSTAYGGHVRSTGRALQALPRCVGARPDADPVAVALSVATTTSSHGRRGGGPARPACHGRFHEHV
ncbi:ADP-ribosylation factor-related protein 1 [Hordeum vulgare]|nr:ADP-ribosylation factor-related protein 1 [Hordeum vulgare]